MANNNDSDQFDGLKNIGFLFMGIVMFVDIYKFYYYALPEILKQELLVRFVKGFVSTGFLNSPFYPKFAIIFLCGLFILLDKGKKDIDINKEVALLNGVLSTSFIILTGLLVKVDAYIVFYLLFYAAAFLYLIKSYVILHRMFGGDVMKDRFNKANKIFPQTKELVENELSINIPYKFVKEYKTQKGEMVSVFEDGFVNIVAPNRAVLILGLPGSGKSYSWVEEIIKQHIKKGFSMINYDFKFPTLSNIAYDYYQSNKSAYDKYEKPPKFATINIDDPRFSDRCNPIRPELIPTKPEAIDAINTIFFNLDKKSAQKQDFFQMSAIAITSGALWFLKTHEGGKYCSLPHLIEFMQQSDEKIITILHNNPELTYFISSFADALKKKAFDQLSGQTASARIPLGKLATDELFYVMTDPDKTGVNLAVNNKEEVTILNIANNPKTKYANAPALGLYMSQAAKLVNSQNRVPCSFNVDELPSIYINGLDDLIATGRSNKICTILSAQDYTQMVRDYGKEIADSIYNTIANKITGQVATDTADKVSKSIGKINYQQKSVTVNKEDTSTQYSTQREYLVPPEDISQFSQGEFAGVVADSYSSPLPIKTFRGFVSPDKSDQKQREVPMVNEKLDQKTLIENRKKIQSDIKNMTDVAFSLIESNTEEKKEARAEILKANVQQAEMETYSNNTTNSVIHSIMVQDPNIKSSNQIISEMVKISAEQEGTIIFSEEESLEKKIVKNSGILGDKLEENATEENAPENQEEFHNQEDLEKEIEEDDEEPEYMKDNEISGEVLNVPKKATLDTETKGKKVSIKEGVLFVPKAGSKVK